MERRLHCKWPLAASWWLKEPMSNQYSRWVNLFMTLVAKFAGRMVTWRSFIHAKVYSQCKTERMSSITTSSSLGFDRGNGGGGKSKNYDWSVRFEKEHGWRNWFKRTLFSVNFHNELKTDFWSMRAIGKICQSTDAKEKSSAWWLFGASICWRRWWI